MSLPPPLPDLIIASRVVKNRHYRWYRAMTRIQIPSWLFVTVAMIWSLGILAGYLFSDDQLDKESEKIALHAWDRTLRVNDALKDAPDWQKWMLNYDDTPDTLEMAADSFSLLAEEKLLGKKGELAFAIMKRELGEKSDLERGRTWQQKAFDHQPLNPQQWQRWQLDLDDGKVTWWDLQLVKSYAASTKDQRFLDEVERENQKTKSSMNMAAYAYAAVWALVILGLMLLRPAWRQVRSLLRQRKMDQRFHYPLHWSLKFVFALFFLSEIFADEISSRLQILHLSFEEEFLPLVINDTIWRMIPALLMMGVLFRHPKVLIEQFGLNQKPRWSLILAVFALLSLFDPMLSSLIDASGSIDPTLGIDPMENGWRGLCYGLLSACIMAPVMEELIFRGFLMNPMLHKWGFWIAAFVTTLLFAISHYYDLYGTISVGLFGFSAAAIYYLTRSLTNTIILHVIYNFTITLPAWLIFHHQA